MIITGMLAIDGQPIANQQVMLLDLASQQIIAYGESDAAGTYTLKPEMNLVKGELAVIAKFRHDDIAAVRMAAVKHQKGKQTVDLSLNTDSLIPVEVSLIFRENPPETVQISLNLKSVANLPDNLLPLLLMTGPGSKMSWFSTWNVRGNQFLVRVDPGQIALSGERIVFDQAMVQNPVPNYSASQVEILSDCVRAEGNFYSGFTLNVQSPLDVEMLFERYVVE